MFTKPIDKKGNILETPGDGACLFNSVAIGLLLNQSKPITKKSITTMSKKLRSQIITKLKDLPYSILAGFINNNKSNMKKASLYISQMKNPKTWGGNLEAKLLNDLVKTEYNHKGIVILDENTYKPIKFMTGRLTHKYTKPIIYITLSDVRHGGCHFSFVVERKHLFKCQH